ncbi:MAG: symmetrical bis(5'-nucleosyl)-tetraphosphatase, partial [Gammaproteobacteria bacterium]
MSTYAIGDVQGCFQELQDLLDKINFDETNDQLWFTGDLINRGPDSLATLRFVKQLNAISVLGNHECHLLAIAAGFVQPGKKDTLTSILLADDRNELIQWISQLPLLHYEKESGFAMLHAGLPPQWDVHEAMALTAEVEGVLQSDKSDEFLENMYGNHPQQWNDELSGWDRLRVIVNLLTRMRYCNADGRMDFKGKPGTQSKNFQPWFEFKYRKSIDNKIIFGHWASLHNGNPGDFKHLNVYPLDTGCVWGRKLTAMRLEDLCFFNVPSRQKKI